MAATATSGGATTLPELRVSNLTTTEGDAGVATIPVPVTLSSPATVQIKVPYTVTAAADNVTDGHGFVAKKGQLTFGIGKTTANVKVATIGDTNMQPDQHVLVTLGTPVGATATVADGVGVLTILDDDSTAKPPATITVSIGDISLMAPDSGWVTGAIPVTLSEPATVKTQVVFTLDCNALSAIHNVQIRTKGTLSFALGAREKTITFQVSSDSNPQQIEDIALNIKSQLASAQVVDPRGDVQINEGENSLPVNQGYPVPNFAPSPTPGESSFDAQSVGDIEQLDLTPSGSQPNEQTNPNNGSLTPSSPSLSYDGRYAAFVSSESDLVPGDTNGLPDVFVRDRLTGTTERVSLNEDGSQIAATTSGAGGYDSIVQISADGRYVVYTTTAALDPSDPADASFDVYLYDRVIHTTELESVDSTGSIIHGRSPSISADGRYVAFDSALRGASGAYSVYVRDRVNETTTLVFKNGSGNLSPAMSANGQFLVMAATGLTCLDHELDLVDLSDGTTERIDVNDAGVGADAGESGPAYTPAISADGRDVAFISAAWNLVPGLTEEPPHAGAYDTNLVHVYVRDRQDLSTTMVGPVVRSDNPLSISGDGHLLAVASHDSTQPHAQVFNLTDGTRTMVGPGSATDSLDSMWWFGDFTALSGDGRYLAFFSDGAGPYPNTAVTNDFVARVS